MLKTSSKDKWVATVLVAVMVVLQFVNVVRVIADPGGFSIYMGLPIAASEGHGFVYVYALRTMFIVLLVGSLLFYRRFDVLFILAVCAMILPVGDAMLAAGAGASTAIVLRHIAIGVYIAVAIVFLWRANRNAD